MNILINVHFKPKPCTLIVVSWNFTLLTYYPLSTKMRKTRRKYAQLLQHYALQLFFSTGFPQTWKFNVVIVLSKFMLIIFMV